MIADKLLKLLNVENILDLKITEHIKFNGDTVLQFHLIKNRYNKYLFEYGPASTDLDFILTEEQAFKNLADVISNFNCKIQFHNLVLPNTTFYKTSKDFNSKVFFRSMEYYEVRIDEILTRYDVLIEKV